jgi:hypothetical protein
MNYRTINRSSLPHSPIGREAILAEIAALERITNMRDCLLCYGEAFSTRQQSDQAKIAIRHHLNRCGFTANEAALVTYRDKVLVLALSDVQVIKHQPMR